VLGAYSSRLCSIVINDIVAFIEHLFGLHGKASNFRDESNGGLN
jgi:hypothetical protein